MRIVAAVSAALLATAAAAAFDPDSWLERRELLTREAERLEKLYAKCAEKADNPAEKVTLPIDTFPSGAVKSLVTAEKAQFFQSQGAVWADGVTAHEYDADGKEISRLEAESLVVDRETKSGWVDGKARAIHGQTLVKGSRVYVSFAEDYVMITTNAEVRSRDFGPRGAVPAAGQRTNAVSTVTASRADYDRRAGVIMMDGAVRLDDQEYKLAADRAWVFLAGTNELRRIVAVGSVAVTNGLRHGSCDRAVYERRSGMLTMYARGAEEPARLVDEGEKGGELLGERIAFRTGAEQVEVDRPVIKVKTDDRDRGALMGIEEAK